MDVVVSPHLSSVFKSNICSSLRLPDCSGELGLMLIA